MCEERGGLEGLTDGVGLPSQACGGQGSRPEHEGGALGKECQGEDEGERCREGRRPPHRRRYYSSHSACAAVLWFWGGCEVSHHTSSFDTCGVEHTRESKHMSGGYCSAFAMSKDPLRPQLEAQHVLRTLVYVPVLLWCRALYCARVLTSASEIYEGGR